MYQLSNFDPQAFINKYWQKRPVLLKGLFTNFQDPIEPDELAGLAAEQEIESRLIIKSETDWNVEHGPFEDYSEYGESDWTLLVQAVDHWWEEGSDLVDAFRFIPNWRIDDLMVSFSTPGGGVGPHLDQYDVFIVQGQGRRHWRVGEKQAVKEYIPHCDLLQIESFEACIDEILEPGDVLYIPPGCPHEGYAVENSLNYSVGFRAPNQQDFISSFADFALAEECFKTRYSDDDVEINRDKSQVTAIEQEQIRHLMQSAINDPKLFEKWLGEYLSGAKHELDIHQPEPHYKIDDVPAMLSQGEEWRKLGGLRTLVMGNTLYINGESWSVKNEQIEFVTFFANNTVYSSDQFEKYTNIPSNIELFTTLINQGFLYAVT